MSASILDDPEIKALLLQKPAAADHVVLRPGVLRPGVLRPGVLRPGKRDIMSDPEIYNMLRVQPIKPQERGFFGNLGESFNRGAASVGASVTQAASNIPAAVGLNGVAESMQNVASHSRFIDETRDRFDPVKTDNIVTQGLNSAARMAHGMVAGVAATALSPAAGAAFWGAQGFGDAQGNAMDAGASRAESLPGAFIAGGVSAAVGRLKVGDLLGKGLGAAGGKVVSKLAPGIMQKMEQTAAGRVGKYLAGRGANVGGEITEEVAEEIGQIVSDVIAEGISGKDVYQNDGWSRVKETVKQTALSMPFLMGGVDVARGAGAVAQGRANFKELANNPESLRSFGYSDANYAATSKLLERYHSSGGVSRAAMADWARSVGLPGGMVAEYASSGKERARIAQTLAEGPGANPTMQQSPEPAAPDVVAEPVAPEVQEPVDISTPAVEEVAAQSENAAPDMATPEVQEAQQEVEAAQTRLARFEQAPKPSKVAIGMATKALEAAKAKLEAQTPHTPAQSPVVEGEAVAPDAGALAASFLRQVQDSPLAQAAQRMREQPLPPVESEIAQPVQSAEVAPEIAPQNRYLPEAGFGNTEQPIAEPLAPARQRVVSPKAEPASAPKVRQRGGTPAESAVVKESLTTEQSPEVNRNEKLSDLREKIKDMPEEKKSAYLSLHDSGLDGEEAIRLRDMLGSDTDIGQKASKADRRRGKAGRPATGWYLELERAKERVRGKARGARDISKNATEFTPEFTEWLEGKPADEGSEKFSNRQEWFDHIAYLSLNKLPHGDERSDRATELSAFVLAEYPKDTAPEVREKEIAQRIGKTATTSFSLKGAGELSLDRTFDNDEGDTGASYGESLTKDDLTRAKGARVDERTESQRARDAADAAKINDESEVEAAKRYAKEQGMEDADIEDKIREAESDLEKSRAEFADGDLNGYLYRKRKDSAGNTAEPEKMEGEGKETPARLADRADSFVTDIHNLIGKSKLGGGSPVLFGKTLPAGVQGRYSLNSAGITLRGMMDIPTLIHEVAHKIDMTFKITDDATYTPELDAELREIIGAEKNKELTQTDRREAFAEFVHAYMLLGVKHPELERVFLLHIPADVLGSIHRHANSFRDFAHMSSWKQARDHFDTLTSEKKGIARQMAKAARAVMGKDKGSSIGREAVYQFIDWREPIFHLSRNIAKATNRVLSPSENPEDLLKILNGSSDSIIEQINSGLLDAHGKNTGISLPYIVDPLVKLAGDGNAKELNEHLGKCMAYGVALRVDEVQRQREKALVEATAEHKAASAAVSVARKKIAKKDVSSEELQAARTELRYAEREKSEARAKISAAESALKLPIAGWGGNMTDERRIASEIIAEFQGNEEYRQTLNRLREWNNAALDYATARGFISQEENRRIQDSYEHYIPMNRLFNENEKMRTPRAEAS